jgi:hypothetical protein
MEISAPKILEDLVAQATLSAEVAERVFARINGA